MKNAIKRTREDFLFSFFKILALSVFPACSGSPGRGAGTSADGDGGQVETLSDAAADNSDANTRKRAARIEVIGSNSAAQLVALLTNPDVCPSGWTALWQQRVKEGGGEEDWLSLQPAWVEDVDDYGDVLGLAEYIAQTRALLGAEIPTMRISVFWPCFMSNPEVRQEFVDLVRIVQDAGYRVELALLHHASYPAQFHVHPDFGMTGGWAHPDAPAAFEEYVEAVITELSSTLEPNSVIYLAIEPVPQLLDGYTHRGGNYPPGGRDSGRSLAQALTNLRDALLRAGARLKEAGLRTAIAPNIRLIQGDRSAPGTELLEYVHNQWLLDALIAGCMDDDFDGKCETQSGVSVIDRLGITYYGTMHASADTVEEFGLPGRPTQSLARRDFWPRDFTPLAPHFALALEWVLEHYGERITDGTLTFGVAEIGFSDGAVRSQRRWLEDYLEAIEKLPVQFLGIHAPFQHAEFSSGDFYFHLVDRCRPCELTEWGEEFLEQMEMWNRQ